MPLLDFIDDVLIEIGQRCTLWARYALGLVCKRLHKVLRDQNRAALALGVPTGSLLEAALLDRSANAANFLLFQWGHLGLRWGDMEASEARRHFSPIEACRRAIEKTGDCVAVDSVIQRIANGAFLATVASASSPFLPFLFLILYIINSSIAGVCTGRAAR